MELTSPGPPVSRIHWRGAARLVPSRFPTVGLLDRVAAPGDLDALFELESWTNDRISAELGVLNMVPPDEWVTGRPMASVIMAAYCHPREGGSRFSGSDRGAWYAARTLDTALAESAYHRTREIAEVGSFDTRVELRLYLADFRTFFHDIRPPARKYRALYDPASYEASQVLGRDLLDGGSNGIVYRSVRHRAGECVACFRPALVQNVRAAGHFEFRWEGSPAPRVRTLQ